VQTPKGEGMPTGFGAAMLFSEDSSITSAPFLHSEGGDNARVRPPLCFLLLHLFWNFDGGCGCGMGSDNGRLLRYCWSGSEPH
jgi:hypothetical protein